MKSFPLHSSKEENYIIELFRLVLPYKWSIFIIMVLSIVLAKYFLYFIPSTYESYAIIQVNNNQEMGEREDFLRESLFKTNSAGINQEMSKLHTYQVNEKALSKVNFQIQYFVEDAYKKVEIYEDLPIEISELSNRTMGFSEPYLMLIPKENGFVLSSKELGESELYAYDEIVKTAYFRAKVSKNRDFNHVIYLKINGNNRSIYEDVIKNSLAVSQVDLESNLIRVTFQDTIPERANNYVNALIEAYINQSVEKKKSTNNKILTFLENQLEKTKVELEVSERELGKYQSQNKSIDPSIKSTNFFEKLSDIDLELSEITLKNQLIENLKIYIKNNESLDAIAPTLLEFDDQSTIRLIDNLNELKVEQDELLIEYTQSYPRVVQIAKRVAELKKKVASNIQNLGSVLSMKRQNLLQQKNKYESVLRTLPQKEKKLISFQRSYEVNSKMYTYLLEKKSENELIKVASVSDYEAVDKAYTPPVPVSPKRSMMLVLAAIIGLALGVFLALIRALMVDKVKTQKDVELLTKLPIYGNIPLYKDKMLMTVALEEAYRKLAMNLQFFKKEEEGNVVLITSAIQGEGKTTTLANLSAIFQNTRYKSIIIDLDMQNPTLHEHFGMEQQYSGISTYLSQRDNLGNVVFSTNHPNLNIITSGPTPPNPIELILSPRLEELLTTLKREYDYIFIDTAAFNVAVETFYLMQYSDINLVVFRENFSKKSSIADLEKLIREKNLRNIGLVLKTMPKAPKKLSKPSQQVIVNKKVKVLS